MTFDYSTRTDDSEDGELPCPWCGEREGDTFEISDGSRICSECGGEQIIESDAVRTVYAFRGEKSPPLDVAKAREMSVFVMFEYLRTHGWTRHRFGGKTNFTTWNPPGATEPSDALANMMRGGFAFVDTASIGDVRQLIVALAAHEGCTPDEMLARIADWAEDS